MFAYFSAFAAALTALSGAPQPAEELPRAAALAATASSTEVERLAGAVDRVLRANLDKLHVVNTAGTPALALAELQLAVGCVGETPSCLTSVAKQLEVDILVLTALDRAGTETVLTVTKFDSRKEGSLKRTVRRASGEKTDSELLAATDNMLRELFGLPAMPDKPVVIIEPEPVERRVLPLPALIVGGVGAVAVVTGIVFAGLGTATENDYAAAPYSNTFEVDQALRLEDRANAQYTTSAVFLAIGGAALATGAILLFFPSNKRGAESSYEPPLAFTPSFLDGPFGSTE